MKYVAFGLDLFCTVNELYWLYRWMNLLSDSDECGIDKKHNVLLDTMLIMVNLLIVLLFNQFTRTSPYTVVVMLCVNMVVAVCIKHYDPAETFALVGGYFFLLFLKGNIEIAIVGILGGQELINQTCNEMGFLRICMLLISGSLLFTGNYTAIRLFGTKFFSYYDKKYYSLVAFVGFIGCCFFGGVLIKNFFLELSLWWSAFLLLLLAFIFYLYRSIKGRELDMYKAYTEREKVLLNKYYQQAADSYQKKAKLYHDMNYHFRIIYNMLRENQTEHAIKYVEELGLQSQGSTIQYHTGIRVLDVILEDIGAQAADRNINFNVDIQMLPQDSIFRSSDICSLFSNLLDNAMNAAQTEISLKIRLVRGTMLLELLNDFLEEPEIRDGVFFTKKKDTENHGWGMRIVQDIVEKYEGDMNYEIGQNQFTIRINMKISHDTMT